MDLFVVKAHGKRLAGWKSINVDASLEEVTRELELEVADWTGRPELQLEDEVLVVVVDGDTGAEYTIFAGELETVGGGQAADSSAITFNGRSFPNALVEDVCPLGGLQSLTLLELARKLANPVDVAVNTDILDELALRPLQLVRARPGEARWDVLERAARRRGVLLTDPGDGSILICTSDNAPLASEALIVGQNVTRTSWKLDRAERAQRYSTKSSTTIKVAGWAAQSAPGGFWQIAGTPNETEVVPVTVETIDPGVRRPRQMLITGESDIDGASGLTRTRVEAARRLGKAIRATYDVVGWRMANGSPWRPNLRVQVVDPQIGWTGMEDLLLVRCGYRMDASGITTSLEVAPRVAFGLPRETMVLPDGLEGRWGGRAARPRLERRRRDGAR